MLQLQEEDVPLTGEPNDLADEDTLVDSDSVPNGITVDPMLLISNGHDNDTIPDT